MFKLLGAKVDEQLNKLDTAVQKELPAVNQLLQRQKLAPIKAEAGEGGREEREIVTAPSRSPPPASSAFG